jgi:hypothetical protein
MPACAIYINYTSINLALDEIGHVQGGMAVDKPGFKK